MSRLTIPCANDCICLPICINKQAHDLFDCCKLLQAHWYQWVTSPKVHRKLSMKRAYNFTTQMNKIFKREYMPWIYLEETHNWNTGKKMTKEIMIFTDSRDAEHMAAKNLFYTISEYEKVGISLYHDFYVGDILKIILVAMTDRTNYSRNTI